MAQITDNTTQIFELVRLPAGESIDGYNVDWTSTDTPDPKSIGVVTLDGDLTPSNVAHLLRRLADKVEAGYRFYLPSSIGAA